MQEENSKHHRYVSSKKLILLLQMKDIHELDLDNNGTIRNNLFTVPVSLDIPFQRKRPSLRLQGKQLP